MIRRVEREGSLYPQLPKKSKVLLHISDSDCNAIDGILVTVSSLLVVGSVAWVPLAYAWALQRWRNIPKEEKQRKIHSGTWIALAALLGCVGIHRRQAVGKFVRFKDWGLWRSWARFVAMEIVADWSEDGESDTVLKDSLAAVVPHGVFPFSLGLAQVPRQAEDIFGYFRPVVATATELFPFVRTILSWCGAVKADRSSVDAALTRGSRIGLAPGGIAEMFEGYPKKGTFPHEEYAILKKRKGFIRMAIKHGLPVVPIYCFGATKMLKRLQLPAIFESISNALRISLVLFFGVYGLPIPFRQKLFYAVGKPIYPNPNSADPLEQQVDVMHEEFCDSLLHLFEKYKGYYGWEHKVLKLV